MRRNIVHSGADALTYEIRSIVAKGQRMRECGVEMVWENIGDPIQKGDRPAPWIMEIAREALERPETWGYCDTKGRPDAREVLADFINRRGGAKVTPDDILFFNGLGDAISTIFAHMRREARVLGPSPAYSTFSSAEAAHSGYEHLTYRLDPTKGWMPDLEEMRMKVHYNDTIAGILLINPNNPTGAVYPRAVLEEIVAIAKTYNLMIICDEIYSHLVFNGRALHLSEVLGDVPALSLRGISKEFPWPGSRCGWIEILNRGVDRTFDRFVQSLLDAKMLEVCSTSLPQAVIPRVFRDARFLDHLARRQAMYAARAAEADQALSGIQGARFVKPNAAFYFSMVFDADALHEGQKLKPMNTGVKAYLDGLLQSPLAPDQRFVYQLMASKGLCVVPLSSFCSPLQGFRCTLLETDDKRRHWIFKTLREAIEEFLAS